LFGFAGEQVQIAADDTPLSFGHAGSVGKPVVAREPFIIINAKDEISGHIAICEGSSSRADGHIRLSGGPVAGAGAECYTPGTIPYR
jgi:hypothetical protein